MKHALYPLSIPANGFIHVLTARNSGKKNGVNWNRKLNPTEESTGRRKHFRDSLEYGSI